MSLEVLLIPLGVAAYSMLKEARSSDLCENCRATRVIDPELLREALQRMGASVVDDGDERMRATGRWGDLTFQKVGDLYLGRVDGGTEVATEAMLGELDQHVGHVVQHRTAALVMERAQELGFRLIEQRDEDGTLNYVFEEIT